MSSRVIELILSSSLWTLGKGYSRELALKNKGMHIYNCDKTLWWSGSAIFFLNNKIFSIWVKPIENPILKQSKVGFNL